MGPSAGLASDAPRGGAPAARPRALRRPAAVVVGLLGLAFALRLAHLGWGLPAWFFPDEAVFFRPATRVAATGDLRTGFTTYPPLSVNLLAATYALAARARGVPADRLAVAERVWLGRCLMLAAAVATVGAVVALGRAVAGPAAGALAGLFTAVLPVHVVQTRIVSSDVLVTLFVALALHAALRWRARPTPGRAVVAGTLVGLATVTKYPGVLVAVAPAAVAAGGAVAALRAGDGAALRRVAAQALLAALAALAAFTLVYPHWLAELDVLRRRLAFLRFVAHTVGNDVARLSPAGGLRGTPVAYQLAILLPGALGVPLALLAYGGVAWLAARAWRRAAPLLLFALAHFAFFATARSVFPRYYLPLAPVLTIAAGAALVALARRGGLARGAAVAAGVLTAGYTLALSASLTAQTGVAPQRALRAAVARLAAEAPAPPRVGFVPDRFGDYTGLRAALRGLPVRPVELLIDPQWLTTERPDLLIVSDVDAVVAERNHPRAATAQTLRALAAGELPYRLAADVRVSYLTRDLYVALDPYFGFSVERGAVGFRVWARLPGA